MTVNINLIIIFREVVREIERKVSEYRKSDKIDNWDINFDVGVDYEKLSIDEISTKHYKLLEASENLQKCELLNRAERGRLYKTLKYSERWQSQWVVLCEERLKICSTTANRNIDFFNLVNSYPGLLITGLSFETIMNNYIDLSNYIDENQQLSDMLKAPLRKTNVSASMKIAADKFPQSGEPPAEYLSCGADWNPGWQFSDRTMTEELEQGMFYTKVFYAKTHCIP
jgi:hypothetical protein